MSYSIPITDPIMYAILIVIVIALGVCFYRLHRDSSSFNLLDLLMENGRVSRLAFAFIVTLIVTSWIMLKLTIDKQMDQGYMIAYGGMWVAPIIAKMFATNAVSESSMTTTTTTSETREPLEPPT